jgi:hypothetical protein
MTCVEGEGDKIDYDALHTVLDRIRLDVGSLARIIRRVQADVA